MINPLSGLGYSHLSQSVQVKIIQLNKERLNLPRSLPTNSFLTDYLHILSNNIPCGIENNIKNSSMKKHKCLNTYL